MAELRCDSKLHGVLRDGVLEIKCRSSHCGAGPDVVILHQFDPLTGDMIKTLRFREPNTRKAHNATAHSAAVRHP